MAHEEIERVGNAKYCVRLYDSDETLVSDVPLELKALDVGEAMTLRTSDRFKPRLRRG
jgi:hypothetical protein